MICLFIRMNKLSLVQTVICSIMHKRGSLTWRPASRFESLWNVLVSSMRCCRKCCMLQSTNLQKQLVCIYAAIAMLQIAVCSTSRLKLDVSGCPPSLVSVN